MQANRKMAKKVAVIIPCYNEAESIERVITELPRGQLLDRGIELSVYVVDNNCTDETTAIAKKAGATILFEPKCGKGNALRTGFNNIPDDADYVVMLDGDYTYSPAEVWRLLEPLHSNLCDVVVGSRLDGHIEKSAMSLTNRFGN